MGWSRKIGYIRMVKSPDSQEYNMLECSLTGEQVEMPRGLSIIDMDVDAGAWQLQHNT